MLHVFPDSALAHGLTYLLGSNRDITNRDVPDRVEKMTYTKEVTEDARRRVPTGSYIEMAWVRARPKILAVVTVGAGKTIMIDRETNEIHPGSSSSSHRFSLQMM